MTVWALIWNQLVLFTESFLEVLDIHFEEAQDISSRRVQQQGVQYLEVGSADGLAQLKNSFFNRLGISHCWLALLVCTWISTLFCINAWEWSKPRAIQLAVNTKTYATEQTEACIAFWQELAIASQRLAIQGGKQVKQALQHWQTQQLPALKAAARNWMPASS